VTAAFPAVVAEIDVWVNRWVGTPFVHDGRTTAGVDCYGLCVRFYADLFGLDLPDWKSGGQGVAWRRKAMEAGRAELFETITTPRNPCVAMIARADPSKPHHMGIYWRGRIVHADGARGVVADPADWFAMGYGAPEFLDFRPGEGP
jgi:cell wall-associated NlpC family hydrolase